MYIRPANDDDIPTIVQLLKLSLGESLMPKSETFWRWKHIDNPFGPSPVLLAFEDDELIGVRAFMRWEWKQGDRIYKAVRAVDTATHPAHQGKGIFKKLTLQLVDQCREEGVHFIFNTPNKSSLPGYLKMGWQEAGRLALRFKLHMTNKTNPGTYSKDDWPSLENHPSLKNIAHHFLTTQVTHTYLWWRYRDNPNAKYHLLSSIGAQPFIVIYRIKPSAKVTEARITELLCGPEDFPMVIQTLQSQLDGIKLITLEGNSNPSHIKEGFIRLPVGPRVTIRDLSMPAFPESLSFGKWSPSLGDLELF
jgi:GNAT superfamily N-acetyltransferase